MTNKLSTAILTLSLLGGNIPSAFTQQTGTPRIGADFITVKPEMQVRQRQALMVSAGKYYFPKMGAFIIYAVMIVILLWRPQGLFSRAGGR